MQKPSDLISPEEKAKLEYGKKIAKYIESNIDSSAMGTFNKTREWYDTAARLAQGKQSESEYNNILHVNDNNKTDSFINNIRQSIRNVFAKRADIFVNKIMKFEYEPRVDVQSPFASSHQDDMTTKIKLYMSNKPLMDKAASLLGTSTLSEFLPVDHIPKNDEDIQSILMLTPRSSEAMQKETALDHHLERNRYQQLRKQVIWDNAILGPSILHVDMDENAFPEIKYIHPGDFVTHRVRHQHELNNLKFAGHIERVTVGELKKLDENNEIDPEELKKLEQRTGNLKKFGFIPNSSDINNERNIEIIKFEYLSQDELTVKYRYDSSGNERISIKEWGYLRRYDQNRWVDLAKEYNEIKKDKRVERKKYNTVYSGYFVPGTDIVFRYGPKKFEKRPFGALGESLLSYIVTHPSLYGGYSSTKLEQAESVLHDIQECFLKLRQSRARKVPNGFQIDVAKLANFTFKFKGQNFDKQAALEYFIRSGILVGPRDAIMPLNNNMGNDIGDYIAEIQFHLENLDEILGFNRVSAATTLPADTGKYVAQMQQANTDLSMSHYHAVDAQMFEEVNKRLIILDEISKWKNPDYYTRIFGKSNVESDRGAYFNIPSHDYGFYAEAKATTEEWNNLYNMAFEQVRVGRLRSSDYHKIKQTKNYRKATALLSIYERMMEERMQQEKLQVIEANNQSQIQSNKITEEEKRKTKVMEIETEKNKIDMEVSAYAEKAKIDNQYDIEKHERKLAEIDYETEVKTESEKEILDKEYDEKVILENSKLSQTVKTD